MIGSSRPHSMFFELSNGAHAFQRNFIAATNPMHQGPANTTPSSVRWKIGAYFDGVVDRISPIALNRAAIAMMASSRLPCAVAILPFSPSRSKNHSCGGIEHGPTTMAAR